MWGAAGSGIVRSDAPSPSSSSLPGSSSSSCTADDATLAQPKARGSLRRPRVGTMIGSEDRVDLLPDQLEKRLDVESMPHRRIRGEILFRKSKQAHRRIEPATILRMRRALILLLQMDKPARGLDQPFEIIRIFRFGPEPEMLEDIVRFVVALFVPAAKEAKITRVGRDLAGRRLSRRVAYLFKQPGNSLAFAHEERNLVSAEMTGNRARILFRGRARARTAPQPRGDG